MKQYKYDTIKTVHYKMKVLTGIVVVLALAIAIGQGYVIELHNETDSFMEIEDKETGKIRKVKKAEYFKIKALERAGKGL